MWFPSEETVLELHERILARTGGTWGILQRGAVHSAIERARWGPFGGDGDLAERAAMLIRGIAQDHPFADGNKRTAFEVAAVFLYRNGTSLEATADEVVAFMLAVASGEEDLETITRWLRTRLRNL